MGRPRKYQTDAKRDEAYKKANRERQTRHRNAKKAEAQKWQNIGDNIELGDIIVDLEPLPSEEVARRAELQRLRDLGAPPIYDDGIEVEVPTFDEAGNRTN